MSTSQSSGSKYSCRTQDEEESSYAFAPNSNFAGTTGELAPNEPDDLVLGYGRIVPRWDVKRAGGRNIQYLVQVSSFPSAERAKVATVAFQEAADSWNELETGVKITETTERSSANFYLVYRQSVREDGTLAEAFFPHEVNKDVIVYSLSFESKNLPILKNIFEHEIGHVLGLRHEFAIEEEGGGAVRFLEPNELSIMSYKFPPTIRNSDKVGIKKFYELPNGFKVKNSPVTDFVPRIRSQRPTPS
jgi:hypothetical protein